MYFTGIDIGSSSAKAVVLDENNGIVQKLVMPTGWSSLETANSIKEKLAQTDIEYAGSKLVATGYGRVSVPYADKTVSEITCHGKGAAYLFNVKDCTVIDIGGQDTKIITIAKGQIVDFIMNDKCSAGTGRFLEIMANTLGVSLSKMFDLAGTGSGISISSMCTVFAETEVISLIGSGQPKKNIAYGVVESIINKVISLSDNYYVMSDVIVVRSDNTDIKAKEDLAGKTVGVQDACTAAQAAEDLPNKGITVAKLNHYTRNAEAYAELANGRIDALVVSITYANEQAKNNPGFKVINDPLHEVGIAVVAKQGSVTLVDKIDEIVAKLKENGTYDKIAVEWLTAN